MLIISIPKSASTSLLYTLGEIHKMESQQDVASVKDNPIPNKFELLGKYHSDCRELGYKNTKNWSVADKLYKQHIPPTKNNLELLHGYKKVILLRDPKEIILAYRRAEKKGLHETRTEFEECATEIEWLDRAKEIGLFGELKRFYTGWTEASTEKHLIHFEDLILDERTIFKTVSKYFDLPIKDEVLNNIELNKYRYSRHNNIQKYVYKVVSQFQKIISSI